jgi:hypothetical protein
MARRTRQTTEAPKSRKTAETNEGVVIVCNIDKGNVMQVVVRGGKEERHSACFETSLPGSLREHMLCCNK